MPKLYRAFSKDFIQAMAGSWPKHEVMKLLFQQRTGAGIGNSTYSELRAGSAENALYTDLVLELMLSPKYRSTEYARIQAVRYFKSKTGREELPPLAEALALACDPPTAFRPEKVASDNWLAKPLSAFSRLFDLERLVERQVQSCHNTDAIRAATRWIFITVGRSTTEADISDKDAIGKAEEVMRITREEYEQRLLTWVGYNRWTVVRARSQNNTPTGIAVLLPLKASTYFRIRSGEMSDTACMHNDFEIPSKHLFWDAVCLRPRDLKGDDTTRASRSLVATCITQAAVLSRFKDIPKNDELRFLGFAGSPIATASLEAQGYTKLGTKLWGDGPDLYEKILSKSRRTYKEQAVLGLIDYLSDIIDFPPPD